MLTNSQDHKLFEEFVTHHKLLAGTRDVSIVVEDTHTGEPGDLNLKGDVGAEITVDHGLFGWVDTTVVGHAPRRSESLIPNLVNHFEYQLLIIKTKLLNCTN